MAIKSCKTMADAVSKKNNTLLDKFWSDKAPSLRENAMYSKADMKEIEAELKSQAKDNILQERNGEKDNITKGKRKQKGAANKTQKKTRTEEPLIESDMKYLQGQELSIGTIIKRNALDLFNKNENKLDSISIRKRKMISNGLSSILDLVDQSYNSQRSLFKVKEWKQLNSHFDNLFKSDGFTLNTDITDTITIITNILNLSGDYKAAMTYIQDMENKYETRPYELAGFRLLHVALSLMKRYNYLFDTPPKKKVLENDYLRLVWSPILEALFPPEEEIRLIAGESINKLSTEVKKDQYSDKKSLRGFKIDTRLVLDLDGSELDLAVGELGKTREDAKAIGDEGKLTREAKEAVDGLVRSINDSNFGFQAYMMQFTDCSCILSKMNLAGNGLYVATHYYSFDLPSCFSDFSKLKPIIVHLLSMKRDLMNLTDKLKPTPNNDLTTTGSLNREERMQTNEKRGWIRDSWHTPPPETKPELPKLFFIRPDIPPLNLACIGDPTDIAASSKSANPDYDGVPDSYGWVHTHDGRYYNIFIKQTRDQHPLDEDQ
jgi:hypothetical protein